MLGVCLLIQCAAFRAWYRGVVHFQIAPNWEVAVRGGYWHSMTPIPDSSFNPQLPDADNHSISAGLGFLCKNKGRFFELFECGHVGRGFLTPQAFGLDLAYQALIYDLRINF